MATSLVVQYPKTPELRPFSRDTLFISLYEALKHRTSASEDATALTATIIAFLLSKASEGVITRQTIVETATKTLERFDKSAATVYRAYHKP